jgi:hypothetical protein
MGRGMARRLDFFFDLFFLFFFFFFFFFFLAETMDFIDG